MLLKVKGQIERLEVIPMPESSDLSLMTDSVEKSRFSMPYHRSELIGSGITSVHGTGSRRSRVP